LIISGWQAEVASAKLHLRLERGRGNGPGRHRAPTAMTATRVLVTGSAGHLGEALVRVLRDGGYDVTGIDVRRSPYTTVVGSVTDRAVVRGCVSGADAVLHAASPRGRGAGRRPMRHRARRSQARMRRWRRAGSRCHPRGASEALTHCAPGSLRWRARLPSAGSVGSARRGARRLGSARILAGFTAAGFHCAIASWHLPASQCADDGVGRARHVGVIEQVKGSKHRVAVLRDARPHGSLATRMRGFILEALAGVRADDKGGSLRRSVGERYRDIQAAKLSL
jgi:hypothetical protein